MKKKKWLIIAGIGILVAIVIVFVVRRRQGAESQYEFVEIERGNIENIVSSTGELKPVGTVEVGTQVSGNIEKVLVNFNDKVKAGQVLVVLDTTVLAASVKDAEANLIKATAQYEVALADYQNNLRLYEKDMISEFEMNSVKANKETAHASLLSAQINLKRAKQNLKYAVIVSPIDGTIIDRNIEPGQTVAASFSTPTLFVIAEDLSKMEIHVSVDESDIGQIKEGQGVRFTVLAYPDEIFTGTVREVRLQPTTIQNVVMYTVIVDASNDKGLLLPGMTADVDFLIEQRNDVLMVNNSALQFIPTQTMLAEFRRNRFERLPDSLKAKARERMSNVQNQFRGPAGFSGEREVPENVKTLWYLDQKGKLDAIPVKTGVTDGKNTEIEGINAQIKIGMKVISRVTQTKEEVNSNNRNLFMPGPPGRR